MQKFTATLKLTGINPFVIVPEQILAGIFKQAGKDRGHIPVCGTINGSEYTQTLVKFKGEWTLYINTKMLKDSPRRIGEDIKIGITFDPADRTLIPHPDLLKALNENKTAKGVFNTLPASRQQEIIRYISFLKTEESITKNIIKAIGFLNGKNRFIGRDKP